MGNLSKLSASFKKVAPIAASFSNVPDGSYLGDLKEMKLGQSKKGRWQVEMTWEVADGDNAGKTQKQFYGISTNEGAADEVGMGYLKNVFEVLGFDAPEDVDLWQEHFDAFVNDNTAYYDITVKSNGNYANVYVNGVSETTKGEEAVEEEVAEEEVAEEVAEEEFAVEEVGEEEVVEEVEEEVQEVKQPLRKMVAKPIARVTAKPVAKVAMPVRKVATAQPVKKVAVPLKRK